MQVALEVSGERGENRSTTSRVQWGGKQTEQENLYIIRTQVPLDRIREGGRGEAPNHEFSDVTLWGYVNGERGGMLHQQRLVTW